MSTTSWERWKQHRAEDPQSMIKSRNVELFHLTGLPEEVIAIGWEIEKTGRYRLLYVAQEFPNRLAAIDYIVKNRLSAV